MAASYRGVACGSLKKRDQSWVNSFVNAVQDADRDWQGETARAGRAGIEEEYALTPLDGRLVRVAVDDCGNLRRAGLEVELREIVQQVEIQASCSYIFGGCQV